MGSVGVWSKWDKGSNGKECVLRRNVSGMRKDSPMLSANTRNDSLDDAFDELLHWASTDDAAAKQREQELRRARGEIACVECQR